MLDGLQARFNERFGGTSTLHRAPGRLNLIGGHADYNKSYAMPVATGQSPKKVPMSSENTSRTFLKT